MNLFRRYQHYLALHFVVFLWGFTGILGKLISVSAYSIVWWRVLIALLGLLTYVAITRRYKGARWNDTLKYTAMGLVVGLHWFLFFEALKVSNVSITLVTLSATSLFVAFIEPVVFNRRIRGYEIGLSLVTIVAIALIFNAEARFSLGIWLSLAAAACSAFFGTYNGKFVQTGDAAVIATCEMLGAWLGMSVFILASPSVSLEMPVAMDWWWLLALGLVCTSLAQVMSIGVMKVLSPYTVTISINMEPVYGICIALYLFGQQEHMSPLFYAGTLLVMGVIVLNSVLKRRLSRRLIQHNQR